MNRVRRLLKAMQRRIYDCSLSKYALVLFSLLVVVATLVALVFLAQTLPDAVAHHNEPWRMPSFAANNNNNKAAQDSSAKIGRYDEDEELNDIVKSTSDDDDEADSGFYAMTSQIDAVYTWVNGSDTAHQAALAAYKASEHGESKMSKLKLELAQYVLRMNMSANASAEEEKEDADDDDDDYTLNDLPCFHPLCMQTHNVLVVVPQLTHADKQLVLTRAKSQLDAQLFANLTMENVDSSVSLIYVNLASGRRRQRALVKLDALLSGVVRKLERAYSIYVGYYTTECGRNATNCIGALDRTFIGKQATTSSSGKRNAQKTLSDRLKTYYSNYNPTNSNTKQQAASGSSSRSSNGKLPRVTLPSSLSREQLLYRLDYVHYPSAAAAVFDGGGNSEAAAAAADTLAKFKLVPSAKERRRAQQLRKDATPLVVFKVRSKELAISLSSSSSSTVADVELQQACIAWDLGDPHADQAAPSRFQDNNELLYSLRSVSKYAPWLRRIYLVTNGQVPAWLNTSHPRIRLVRHEQIFANRSHLPTFSSPAIESHLHRIPGLSRRFIYFNDDFMLMRRVYPSDFFTRSAGFRIHLAWTLPGCNTACPNTWIRDGYCDKACNTSECEWDGGDCEASAAATAGYDAARLMAASNQRLDFYCSQGCATTWLGDKYCDNSCNVLNCAYDMGDCGDSMLRSELFGVKMFDEGERMPAPQSSSITKLVRVPFDVDSFYLDFDTQSNNDNNNKQAALYSLRVTSANYEENRRVRKMTVFNRLGTLVVLLMPRRSSSTNNATTATTTTTNNNTLLRIYVQLERNDTSQMTQINMTLLVELDAIITAATKTTKAVAITTSQLARSSLTASIDSNRSPIPLRPVLLNNSSASTDNNEKSSNDSSIINNRFFRSVYDNYRDYLNWSLANGYLTPAGLAHKLSVLRIKLSDEALSQVYAALNGTEEADLDFDEDERARLAYQLLFGKGSGEHLMSNAERNVLLTKYLNESKTHATSKNVDASGHSDNNNNMFAVFRKRKLLDTFADSLRYVNKFFNELYGFMPRKVPAHMPYIIDRQIMSELQRKFKREFEQTSSHRLRSSSDMQYAFTFYYYVMSELAEFNATRLFAELDVNGDERLDTTELWMAGLRLSAKPFIFADFWSSSLAGTSNSSSSSSNNNRGDDIYQLTGELRQALDACPSSSSADPLASKRSEIDRSSFLACEGLVELLRSRLWARPPTSSSGGGGGRSVLNRSADPGQVRYKYKYEVLGDDEAKFVMISGNPLEVQLKLNNLIRRPPKFVCLNDNIDHRQASEADELRSLLAHFYASVLPLRSPFEIEPSTTTTTPMSMLPTGGGGDRMRIDEMADYAHHHLPDHHADGHSKRIILYILVLLISALLFVYVAKKVLKCLLRCVAYLLFRKRRHSRSGGGGEVVIARGSGARHGRSTELLMSSTPPMRLQRVNTTDGSVATAIRLSSTAANASSSTRKSKTKAKQHRMSSALRRNIEQNYSSSSLSSSLSLKSSKSSSSSTPSDEEDSGDRVAKASMTSRFRHLSSNMIMRSGGGASATKKKKIHKKPKISDI